MEDGCVTASWGAAPRGRRQGVVVEMRQTTESQKTAATEAAVRGSGRPYRRHMGY